MAYADTDKMVERFGLDEMLQLTNSEADDLSEDDAAKIGVALDDASALIDGYVRVRHKLPLNPVPALLVRVCCDIARHYLYKDIAPDNVKDAYQQSVKTLEQIAKGVFQLTTQTGGAPASAGEVVMVGGDNRIFSQHNFTGF